MHEHVKCMCTFRQKKHPIQFKKETSTIFVVVFLEKWGISHYAVIHTTPKPGLLHCIT